MLDYDMEHNTQNISEELIALTGSIEQLMLLKGINVKILLDHEHCLKIADDRHAFIIFINDHLDYATYMDFVEDSDPFNNISEYKYSDPEFPNNIIEKSCKDWEKQCA